MVLPVLIFSLVTTLCFAPEIRASLWPSWIPLAVRSPYLTTWMNTTNIPFDPTNVDGIRRTPTEWTSFLSGTLTSWSGLIRVDGNQTFAWLGDTLASGEDRTVITDMHITPTRTILNVTAGPLDLTLTFLSPIEPADPVLQSLPFSYLTLEASSNDGLQHQVQVYTDIDTEWLAGSRQQNITFSAHTTDKLLYYQIQLQDPQSLTESQDQAEDSTVFYAMPLMSAQTYMIAGAQDCRNSFGSVGKLQNTFISSPQPSRTQDADFPSFAFSIDLGTISATKSPVVWALGLTRDPAVGYTINGTIQNRSPYWASSFNDASDAVATFVSDYQDTFNRAVALDQKITTAAAGVSAHYADLVSLAARQAMSGTELTIGRSSSDSTQWNTSDVKMFMKSLGGLDDRVNPVEGLYQAFPFFLFINATYGGWLLEPILEFSSVHAWPYSYAPRDIGTNYPNVAGNFNSHTQGVEQTGNMLIMVLAHARATGDGSLISQYYGLLKQWADYLGNNSFPLAFSQESADTTDGAINLTNVALKGIIGLKAMSEISTAVGVDTDAQRYANTSSTLAALWETQAVSSDGKHVLTSFGDTDASMALTYNLFADALLQTNVISSDLYASQTEALKTLVSTSSDGLPVDSGLSTQANTVWSLFAAAYTNDTAVQQDVVDQIWNRVATNTSDRGIFSLTYGLGSNSITPQNGSPLVGGVFSILSLSVPNTTIIVRTNSSDSTSATSPSQTGQVHALPKSSNLRAILGGVFGGLGGAALLGLGFLFWRKRRLEARSPHTDLMMQSTPFLDEASYDPSSDTVVMNQAAGRSFDALSGKAMLNPLPLNPSNPSLSTNPMSTSATSEPTASLPTQNSDPQELHLVVENLRRLVQTMQDSGFESPPEYRSQVGS